MNNLKRLGAVLLAVIAVGGICYLSWDYKLTASEGDGSSTAVEQQQTMEEAAKPVEVVVPVKEDAPEEVSGTEEPAEVTVSEVPVKAEPAEAEEAEVTADPTGEYTTGATSEPTAEPTVESAAVPTAEPSAEPAIESTPEATVEPTAEPTPEVTAEPTVEPTPEVTAEPTLLPEIALEVRLVNDGQLYFGDTVELEAILDGVEGVEYTLQWQYNDGNGWKDIAGENGEKYRFGLTVENAEYVFRAAITSDSIA